MSKYGRTFKTLRQVEEATHKRPHNTVSPQHKTFKLQTFKDAHLEENLTVHRWECSMSLCIDTKMFAVVDT